MKKFVIAVAAVVAIGMFIPSTSNHAFANPNNGWGNGGYDGTTDGSNNGEGFCQCSSPGVSRTGVEKTTKNGDVYR